MSGLLQEFVQVGLYKRTQGKIARQVTFAGIALGIGIGLYRLHDILIAPLGGAYGGIEYWLPGILLVLGVWFAYRLVNFHPFADFLIGVEAEMAKVSWPTRHELVRASIVVLVMLIVLAALLWTFDLIWFGLFKSLGIL